MINKSSDLNLLRIKSFYEDAFKIFDKRRKLPPIELVFYPYTNINHTIRIRKGKVLIRIADMFESAPTKIHRSLAYILVGKLLKKQVSSDARKTYREFVSSEKIQRLAFQNKRKRGKKIITSSNGTVYSLDDIFGKLNLLYFQNKIAKPILSWSKRRTYSRLGHYDSAHNTVVISKSLDDAYVPKFVVEYIVFHELLHIKHPTEYKNGRRYSHTTKFRQDEKDFPYLEDASGWIDENAAFLKKSAKKREWSF